MRQVGQKVDVAPESPLALAERLGQEACGALDASYRSGMGQFLTPPGVADLLARMFESAEGEVRLLDLGAGAGALTAAFVEDVIRRERRPRSLHLTAWEIEQTFIGRLNERRTKADCCNGFSAYGQPGWLRLGGIREPPQLLSPPGRRSG